MVHSRSPFLLFLRCFMIFFYCLVFDVSTSMHISAKRNLLTSQMMKKVTKLNEHGKSSMKLNQYNNALWYYSGIMSSLEGITGFKATQIRRRCGLSLADCEIKRNCFKRAIARCSEVILDITNDFPDDSQLSSKSFSKKSLLRTLALAHYKRAVALKLLELNHFSIIDLRDALKYQPDDSHILEEIVDIHFKLDKHGNATDAVTLDQFQDFIDQCLVNFPKISVTEEKINDFCSTDLSRSFPPQGNDLVANFQSPLGLLPFSGGQNSFISELMQIFHAVKSVKRKLQRLWLLFSQNLVLLVGSSSFLWVIFTLLSQIRARFVTPNPK